tara:strand:+ start:2291 stop:3313 length:1023 start_codon:yes stop_codon:yes gene_type:complete
MIRVGINGFGRIGRAVFRNLIEYEDIEIIQINDIDPNIENLAYLLKYDTHFGRFKSKVNIEGDHFKVDGKSILISSGEFIDKVKWKKVIDIIIDSSGVSYNINGCKKMINDGLIQKSIITHSPENVDATIIIGANEDQYDKNIHHVVSSSICDAVAVSPILSYLDHLVDVEHCMFTTLHPWLGYQNLLDGSLNSVSNPGHFWTDYALGRNSTENLIPKQTTAAKAVKKVLPEFKNRLDAISFRVPTAVVSCSDLTISFKKNIKVDQLVEYLKQFSRDNQFIHFNHESLVSSDYKGTKYASIIDGQWLNINNKLLKVILWYDNEYGYASRVCELTKFIMRN